MGGWVSGHLTKVKSLLLPLDFTKKYAANTKKKCKHLMICALSFVIMCKLGLMLLRQPERVAFGLRRGSQKKLEVKLFPSLLRLILL